MKRTDLAGLSLFTEVVARGGFRGAAKALGISPSAVSHGIASLERRLGVRLLNRTTRSLSPTEAGLGLIARLAPALADIDRALVSLTEAKDEPQGVLRLTTSQAAARLLLIPHLRQFGERYPGIRLDLQIESQLADIVAQNFDAGIRLGESLEQDMIAVRIGTEMRGIIVGSPSYLASCPAPRTPEDLRHHRCICLRFGGGQIYRWELEKAGQTVEADVSGPLTLNDDGLMIEAARAGMGLAYVFEGRVKEDIAQGRLVQVLDEWCPSYPGFFLYYPRQRHMRPALRAFIDFIRHVDAY